MFCRQQVTFSCHLLELFIFVSAVGMDRENWQSKIPFLYTLFWAKMSCSKSAALIQRRTDWGSSLIAWAAMAFAVSVGCQLIRYWHYYVRERSTVQFACTVQYLHALSSLHTVRSLMLIKRWISIILFVCFFKACRAMSIGLVDWLVGLGWQVGWMGVLRWLADWLVDQILGE